MLLSTNNTASRSPTSGDVSRSDNVGVGSYGGSVGNAIGLEVGASRVDPPEGVDAEASGSEVDSTAVGIATCPGSRAVAATRAIGHRYLTFTKCLVSQALPAGNVLEAAA